MTNCIMLTAEMVKNHLLQDGPCHHVEIREDYVWVQYHPGSHGGYLSDRHVDLILNLLSIEYGSRVCVANDNHSM